MLHFTGDERRYELSSTEKDFKEKLLCSGCEQLLSSKYEGALKETLFLRRKTKVLFDHGHRYAIEADNEDLALGLVSILWRATVSSLNTFLFAALPKYMTDEMAVWLLNGKLPDNWRKLLAVTIQEIRAPGVIERLAFVHGPTVHQREPLKNFDFVFLAGGYKLIFTIPPGSANLLGKTLALKPRCRAVSIDRVNFDDVPELQATLRDMRASPMPIEIQEKLDKLLAQAQARRRKYKTGS